MSNFNAFYANRIGQTPASSDTGKIENTIIGKILHIDVVS